MAVFEAVTPDMLGRGDDTPGIERKVAFETENNIVVHTAGIAVLGLWFGRRAD